MIAGTSGRPGCLISEEEEMETYPLKNGPGRALPRKRNPVALRQLGWPHYWLLVSILASGLMFFVLILVMGTSGK